MVILFSRMVITWSTMLVNSAQEVGAEMLSVVVASCRLFRARRDARRESMSARAELTASAVSLAADASAMAASAFTLASSAALAVELVLPSLGSVLGSTSGLVLVVAEAIWSIS